MTYLVYLLVGIALGGVVAWFLAAGKSGSTIAVLKERLSASESLKAELDQRSRDVQALQTTLAQVRTAGEKDKAAAEEKLALLEEAKQRLGKEFENLANRIFEDRSGKLAGDHRAKLDEILKPFKDQLVDFRKSVDDIYSHE